MRIGLLGDTHLPGSIKEPWPEITEAFRNVDLILHAGDITSPSVLDWLERIAPVRAAKGNEDSSLKDPRVREVQFLEVEGWRLGLIHDIEPEDRPVEKLRRYFDQPIDIMLSGHTHFERMDMRDGVFQMNPGSAIHPHLYSTRLGTVGIIDISANKLEARVVRLGNDCTLRNPGRELQFSCYSPIITGKGRM